jgi:NDP-sugar pyrophosphorylase family protein
VTPPPGHDLAAVVLAAGAGTRLAPLTRLRPKALCPVATRPLVDHALARVATALPDQTAVAVNLHHGGPALDAHLPDAVHRSWERPEALGTAGALGALRPWLDGRAVLVTNADAWLATAAVDQQPDDEGDADGGTHGGTNRSTMEGGTDGGASPRPPALGPLVAGWDGERVRLLCVETGGPADFGTLRYCGVALLPASLVARLTAEPSGLYEVLWRHEAAAGRLDLVVHPGPFVDCGTPARYLRANLLAGGGAPVVDPSATVDPGATLTRTVVWDHTTVAAGEVLVDAVRAGPLTVLVR